MPAKLKSWGFRLELYGCWSISSEKSYVLWYKSNAQNFLKVEAILLGKYVKIKSSYSINRIQFFLLRSSTLTDLVKFFSYSYVQASCMFIYYILQVSLELYSPIAPSALHQSSYLPDSRRDTNMKVSKHLVVQ